MCREGLADDSLCSNVLLRDEVLFMHFESVISMDSKLFHWTVVYNVNSVNTPLWRNVEKNSSNFSGFITSNSQILDFSLCSALDGEYHYDYVLPAIK